MHKKNKKMTKNELFLSSPRSLPLPEDKKYPRTNPVSAGQADTFNLHLLLLFRLGRILSCRAGILYSRRFG